MVIEIKEQQYVLNFGFEFLAKLNDFYHIEQQGMRLNQGLNVGIVGLIDEEPEALVIFIMSGLASSDIKPSKKDIQDYLIDYANNQDDGLNGLFEEMLAEVKKQPLLKGKIKKLEKQMGTEI